MEKMMDHEAGLREIGELFFTTFHRLGMSEDRNRPERIVAAYYKDEEKEMEGGTETEFVCQFSFCSPKEKTSWKALGQDIALKRLLSTGPRGGVTFSMPEGFTSKMLRQRLKELAVEVARKKKITWMRDITEDKLV